MIKNIGSNDKKLRVLFSLIIALLAIIFQVWWLFIITALLFVTAFAGFCPLYKIFNKNTNHGEPEPQTKEQPKESLPLAETLTISTEQPNNQPKMIAVKTTKKKAKAKKAAKAKSKTKIAKKTGVKA